MYMKYFTILIISIFLLILYGCSGNKFIKVDINIIDIKEVPIKDDQGKIESLKFSLIVDPETPLEDGEYNWNACALHTISPYEIIWPRDQSYHNVTQIGLCKDQELIVRDNTFDFVLRDSAINQIIKYELDGPFLLFIFDKLFQYNIDDINSITYNLIIDDIFTEEPQFEEDKKNDYAKRNVPYKKSKYYKTDSYTYDQFIEQ